MKLFVLVFGMVFYLCPLNSQIVNREPLSPRITGYSMDVELNPAEKTITGSMRAYWINPSDNDVPDIQLHMYLNAFRNNRSTYYRELGGSPGSGEDDPGWIEIRTISDVNGNDLSGNMGFISPDDNNPDDMTVLRIVMPEPVKPGDTVFINVDFVSKLPSNIRRTGFSDNFFFAGQWFPKFGVYEPAGMRYAETGGWNCHQFHEYSEFYSNHSTYDVNITVPEEYIVGTGGMLIEEKKSEDGKKVVVTRAEDIVDYAWTAWPGYAVYTDQWKHVKITFLSPPERKDQVGRQLAAVKNALEYLSDRVGPFPWPHLTFIDPPSKGSGCGGMEYTTLFTSMSSYGLPEYVHLPEMVTIHEFGHAYFMGILASNEFEEPWLDEGVNSFWEERIVDHYYGPAGGMLDHPLLKITDLSTARSGYINNGSNRVISNAEYSWHYPHGTYSMMSYQKAALWLHTMMGIIGEETVDAVFREYYNRWAFKHPSGKDFINVVNDVVKRELGDKYGPDMNWYFDQVLYGSGVVDYKVRNFFNRKIYGENGLFEAGDSLVMRTSKTSDDTLYNSTVEIERIGDVMLPVEVLVHFDNGEEVLETWDGKARYKDFTYSGPKKVDWVKVDPEYKICLDLNYRNNSMTVKPDRKPVRRFTNKIISFLQFYINFISL